MPKPRNAEESAKETATQIPDKSGRVKTKKLIIPAAWLLEFLKTPGTVLGDVKVPPDARIVGTGWDRVYDEKGKPFAHAIYLYVESAEFESGEEPEV